MPLVQITLRLPATLWLAVQALAPHDGDASTVVLRAVEDYVTATRKRRSRHRPGKHQKLVKALSPPVADLHLSARPATALHVMHIRYVYEPVAKEPRELRMMRNFGERSFREVRDKLAVLGLTLGMTLDRRIVPMPPWWQPWRQGSGRREW